LIVTIAIIQRAKTAERARNLKEPKDPPKCQTKDLPIIAIKNGGTKKRNTSCCGRFVGDKRISRKKTPGNKEEENKKTYMYRKKKKKNYKNEREIDGSPQTVWIWPLFSVSI
jgi:hypothetical protein